MGGNNNTADGKDALAGVTSGGSNLGVGISAGSGITTGSSNSAVGPNTQAGIDGSNNSSFGNGAGAASSPHQIVAGESNRIVMGNNSVTNAYIVAAWLAGIIFNLLTYPGFYDVALRDVGLLLAALTLARLASVYDPPWRRRADSVTDLSVA